MGDATAAGLRNRSLSILRSSYAWLQANPLLWSGGLFLAALLVYVAFQTQIVPTMGIWFDELFSLWAGDPRLPFSEAFTTRILPDTNGPIYFSAVYLAQAMGLTDRIAFLVVNYAVIGVMLALILERGWRHDLLATALCAVALLLVTAPLLLYGPEGRVYGTVMAVCAVPAFEAGRLLTGVRSSRNDLILVAVLGAIAAWMHVFGAIFFGALGAAMILTGAFVMRRRDVVVWGFVAGASTTAAFLIWIAIAFPLFTGTTSWIQFNKEWILTAFWWLKNYMIGPVIGLLVAGGFIGLSLIPRHSRPVALVVVITGLLFFAIPFAVSFKMPIFLHRYLLVGCPGLLVLLVFLLRSHLVAREGSRVWRQGLGVLGALFLVLPAMQGIPSARQSIAARPDWLGWRPVLQAAATCPAGEIRTMTFMPFQFGFEHYLKGALKSVPATTAPLSDVSQIDCPAFAWGEHLGDEAETISVEQVLGDFKLTNTTGIPLVLIQHPGGFVLAREDANLN